MDSENATVLSEDERHKVIELVESQTMDGLVLASSLLSALKATPDVIQSVFSRETIARVVETWDPTVWEHVLRLAVVGDPLWLLFVVTFLRRWVKNKPPDRDAFYCSLWRERAGPCCAIGRLLDALFDDPQSEDTNTNHWFSDDAVLCLDFLSQATPDILQEAAEFKGPLHLNGLAELQSHEAAILSGHKGWLYLTGLTTVSDATAEHLVRHQSDVYLDGLTSLTHQALAEKLTCRPWLYLCGLRSVSIKIATVLSSHKGTLILTGLDSPPFDIATILARHQGPVQLKAEPKSVTNSLRAR